MAEDPTVKAVADKLLRLYGRLAVWRTDRDRYEDAEVLVAVARNASPTSVGGR